MLIEFERILRSALPDHAHSIRGKDGTIWATGKTLKGLGEYEISPVDTASADAIELLRMKVNSIKRQIRAGQ